MTEPTLFMIRFGNINYNILVEHWFAFKRIDIIIILFQVNSVFYFNKE